MTTAVAALGALVAGYFTPDRAPVLPPSPQSVAASALDVAPLVPFPAGARRRRQRAPVRRRPAAQHRSSGHA